MRKCDMCGRTPNLWNRLFTTRLILGNEVAHICPKCISKLVDCEDDEREEMLDRLERIVSEKRK